MTKNVLVRVKGVQQDDAGEMCCTETAVPGEYYFRKGSHYIFYEETAEDSGESIKNSLKLKEHKLELTRKGAINSLMVFETGKCHITDYITPFGRLQLETVTSRILLLEEKECIRIKAEYELRANEARLSKCKLSIILKSI